jgi:hypothetical protein
LRAPGSNAARAMLRGRDRRNLSALLDASDDDISAFKAHGGKLLLMHGTVDSAVPPQNTIDYYERLVARFGQGPLDEFARFYVAPGFGHGTGQFVVGWDALGALETRVEKGEAPVPRLLLILRKATMVVPGRCASTQSGHGMFPATSTRPRASPCVDR